MKSHTVYTCVFVILEREFLFDFVFLHKKKRRTSVKIMEETGQTAVRRRRRIVRHQREKTPDPTAKPNGTKRMYSDEESSSTNEVNSSLLSDESGTSRTRTNHSNVAYKNKILAYRDRGCGTAVVRSKSTPRSQTNESSAEKVDSLPRTSSSNQVLAFFQQAKRSLSIPR